MENQLGSRAKEDTRHEKTRNLPNSKDGKRERTRSSKSENLGSEEGHFHHDRTSHGVRGEKVWFNSSLNEKANDASQTTGSGNPPVSSSKDRIPRTLVFRAKRNGAQQSQEKENQTYTRSYASHPQPRGSTHQRSSSEPQRDRHFPKSNRKRVFSETERAPHKRDNITMSGLQGLAQENIWFDKSRYDEAERCFYETKNGVPQTSQVKTSLQASKGHTRSQKPRERKTSQNASKPEDQSELVSRFKSLELDNKNLHKVVDDLRATLSKLESRMAILEKGQSPASKSVTVTKAAPVQTPKVEKHNGAADDDDDDIDLFGSDEEDEEAERIKAERVKEYSQRKAKKPALIAKSSILLDVKPWDDETDMSKLEGCVRSIQMDGLLWGASKLVPVGYGIKKLQINCVVEDDKVGTDILEEEITKYEDYVQSVDIAAFNKI
ncbi:eukaryotic translation elongation factor 1 delta a (guanine nucleotide exchange protein) isoform X2 [Pimephales promelas]|uniref:eukaryotic translation elongation factor 1 delta a (guanine nucleotide exchange protein) isoform X2 n=2 Tax=Pimephales promelas TaxID=90988 RepID=UPI001955F0F1|nr:eukaryotic translation elongation factor 1 delta a (guanine nucleotide exchange protein) isoform X2 [Pimephales promelas]XP_039532147.1 eukaryotic translation elongation factor 1 delta a (guanine nucleotide exchange protein) isoform X2 [Pimephales promelas]